MLKQLDFQEAALDSVEHHLSRGTNRLLGVMATGLGKGQPLHTPIPTTRGMITYAELEIGDEVFGSNGLPTLVTGIYDRPVQPTYRVRFSDDTEEIVDGDHLWAVHTRTAKYHGRPNALLSTLELMERKLPSPLYVPVAPAVTTSPQDFPLDPYVLGALIGDGGLRGDSMIFSSGDPELVREIEARTGWSLHYKDRYDYTIDSPKTGTRKEAQTILRDLGLKGLGSRDKFIPEPYFNGSIEQRLDLLRGLMDTDGTVQPASGTATFCTVSKQLIQDVARLVRSLGGITKVRPRTTNGGLGYAFRLTVNTAENPFLLSRKAALYGHNSRSKTKRITSVEPTGEQEATRCISVAAEDSLYLTGNYTVTHNTAGVSVHVPRRFENWVRRQKDGHGGLLFIVHRREIVYDTYEAYRSAYPDKWVGIEMGEQHVVGDEDIVVASADSIGTVLSNRILKMGWRKFGAILTDEGHHLTIDSKWDNVLNFFGVGSDKTQHFTLPNGEKPISLILTATPNRTDGRGLYPFADDIAFEYNYLWGVRNGWLVDVRAHWLVDESGVSGKERATETEIDLLARAVRDYGRGQKSLMFARSVQQSAILAATLNERGIVRAGHVDGTTDKDVRREMFAAYRAGDLDLLTNYAVFQEGTNVPGIEVIFDNAPTSSPVLGPQKIGRGTRPHPDAGVYTLKTAAERKAAIAASPKPYLTYIACFDPRETNLNIVASLTGKETNIRPEKGQTITEIVDVIERIESELPEVPIRDIETLDDLRIRLKEVSIWNDTIYNDDIKALTPLTWVQRGDDMALYLPSNPFSNNPYDQTPVIVELRKRGDRYEQRLVVAGGWNKYTRKVRPATAETVGWVKTPQEAVRKIDSWLQKKAPSAYRATLRGSHDPATPEQVKYLKNAGVSFEPSKLTRGTADVLMADNRIRKALENSKPKTR